ncbi:N-formylglutamate amidohydrolase [Rhodopila sp.]|jgi:N-formylglutamate deformylase|uniref:N-formylglutamate amidohydrolase n=1 Tax=Rhodopila sp. TaxID=2480087 RepID=UPI002B83789A|nr:N-formylglutamate amidohydrolase [Rhodopila sp.]HVZ09600.1 N-formylglutamate amidohydrolase [Rhodopila sp.]
MDGPISPQLGDDETAAAHAGLEDDGPITLRVPRHPFAPVVFTSSHSGRAYSADFVAAARLCPLSLRRSEDSFVDELFSAAPEHGAPLLCANFPRAFCDANREAWELDPGMFADPLPDWVNSTSPRVGAGLGTIARVVASGEPIYRGKLSFAEAEKRIMSCWRPFHDTLARLIADVKARFGYCWVIDCHSMPSTSQVRRLSGRSVDFVLGDLHGTACASRATRFVESHLIGQGFVVRRNDPYAGGFITAHYGRPSNGVHVLQVEIARSLYMDEVAIARLPDFPAVQARISSLIDALTREAHDLVD